MTPTRTCISPTFYLKINKYIVMKIWKNVTCFMGHVMISLKLLEVQIITTSDTIPNVGYLQKYVMSRLLQENIVWLKQCKPAECFGEISLLSLKLYTKIRIHIVITNTVIFPEKTVCYTYFIWKKNVFYIMLYHTLKFKRLELKHAIYLVIFNKNWFNALNPPKKVVP